MTRQSLAADVLDALVATWTADATLAGYGNRLRIFDGPPLTDRASEIELWVGATGLQPDETVVSGTQDFATLDGLDDRDETLDISCAVWVANGTNDIAAARRTALDVFTAAAAAVRGSSLGIAELHPDTQVISWDLRQGQWTSGVGAVVAFVVRATGQL